MEHISVLLKESIDLLEIREDGIYIDCTLGRGGHSSEILKRIPHGHLYAFDLDQQAIDESRPRLEAISDRFTLIHAPFEDLDRELDRLHVGKVDGILMDLGVSSPQFDDPERGFSYRFDARLDMRMDQSQTLDAACIVNTYSREELLRVLREYGEEPNANRIVNAILQAREVAPIETTFQLSDLIRQALPAAVLKKKGHPAKQTFRALRMEVNRELPQLRSALEQGLRRLKVGGRMAVITFHSLEDRIVKQAFAAAALPKKVNRRIPIAGDEELEYRLINRKPIQSTAEELEENNRAHSAKLRELNELQTRKKTHKRALRSKNKYGFWKKLIIACAVITGIGALTTRLFVRQMSTTKSVENRALVSQINEKNTAISDLQTEIAQLEEKSRVLGMLEGQVSDNQANVYYYSK